MSCDVVCDATQVMTIIGQMKQCGLVSVHKATILSTLRQRYKGLTNPYRRTPVTIATSINPLIIFIEVYTKVRWIQEVWLLMNTSHQFLRPCSIK